MFTTGHLFFASFRRLEGLLRALGRPLVAGMNDRDSDYVYSFSGVLIRAHTHDAFHFEVLKNVQLFVAGIF